MRIAWKGFLMNYRVISIQRTNSLNSRFFPTNDKHFDLYEVTVGGKNLNDNLRNLTNKAQLNIKHGYNEFPRRSEQCVSIGRDCAWE